MISDRLGDPNILILCPRSLCDALAGSAVPAALRQAFPTAHIAWLAEPTMAPVARAIPGVDEVLTIDPVDEWRIMIRDGKWRQLFFATRACAHDLRLRGFDITIDLQGTVRNGWLARKSGASRRIGPACGRPYQWYMTDPVEPILHATRLTQRAMGLLAPLGIEALPARPALRVAAQDRALAEEFLAARGIFDGHYIACCPATSCDTKSWVWSHWGALADRLYRRLGVRTVFVGGPERRADSLRLTDGIAGKPVSAMGHMTLMQSAAIVQGAMLAIGIDTGLTYTALAANVPSVVLFGPTDPTRLAEEPNTAVSFNPVPCSPCRHQQCRHQRCMDGIDIAHVEDAALSMIHAQCVLA